MVKFYLCAGEFNFRAGMSSNMQNHLQLQVSSYYIYQTRYFT